MEDKILRMFFEPHRWEAALEKGVVKDMPRAELIRLTRPEVLATICQRIEVGQYKICPPHTALIPKNEYDENGKMKYRMVFINEPMDRILLSVANDLFFELMRDRVHKNCHSYLKGTGCNDVVQKISKRMSSSPDGQIVGFKSDLSKYFDSVPLRYIDREFDRIEERHGKSRLVDVIRQYYHCNLYFDGNGELRDEYQSLKQGCAVASYLADVILYDVDERMSKVGDYTRYSDDMLYLGENAQDALLTLETELNAMGMKLNPKKVEYIEGGKWFKFLGYAICGKKVSLSKSRIKKFQKEIEARTIGNRKATLKGAINAVHRFLYKGDGEHSWATLVLRTINVEKDVLELNKFIQDCIRAVATGRKKIGGLGYDLHGKDCCILRGKGRNVKANREKMPVIEGYMPLGCARNALLTCRAAYDTLVAQL